MKKPWTLGSLELLEHAATHLKNEPSSFDSRIAFISIDNAVEIGIRTYLGLPPRIRKRPGPKRTELESAFSFPDLLDLLEKYGTDSVNGIEIENIEWFHRLRNQLYHDGNGLTVGSNIVKAYLQLAKLLYDGLFEENTVNLKKENKSSPHEAVFSNWALIDKQLRALSDVAIDKPHDFHDQASLETIIEELNKLNIINSKYLNEFNSLEYAKNFVTQGGASGYDVAQIATRLWNLSKKTPFRREIGELTSDKEQARRRIFTLANSKYSHPEEAHAFSVHMIKECNL